MRKRVGRLLPLCLLTGLSLYFLFRPTGEHAPLFNAISPGAEWISLHESPGDRYDALLALPWVQHLLDMTGTQTDSGTRFWIRELFPRQVLLAREGGMGPGFSPGWVLVSRISGRQARLRLMLDLLGLDGYERTGKHNGNVLWTRFEEGKTPLTVTLANGKLIFVVHEDPQAIRDVLERLEGRRHRFLAFRAFPETLLPAGEGDDRGIWLGNVHWPEPFGVMSAFSDPVSPLLRITGPGNPFRADAADTEANRFAARLGGPSTLAMLRFPASRRREDGLTHVLLMGGRFRSPLTLVNLPTAVLVQSVETEPEALARAEGWMRALQHLTGLAWTGVDTREGRIFLPEDRMIRGFIPAAHRPFAGWREGRLLVSSSAATLDRLLQRMSEPAADFELRDVPWRDADTFLWISGRQTAMDLQSVTSILHLVRWQGIDARKAASLLEGIAQLELLGQHSGDEAHIRLKFLRGE